MDFRAIEHSHRAHTDTADRYMLQHNLNQSPHTTGTPAYKLSHAISCTTPSYRESKHQRVTAVT